MIEHTNKCPEAVGAADPGANKTSPVSEVDYSAMRRTRTRKRAPAYSRPLAEMIRAGCEPYHGIAVWLDLPAPDAGIFANLACFSDTDPESLDWSLCRGRDVIVPWAEQADPDRLERLLDAITAAGPTRLQAWHSSGEWVRYVILGGATS